MTTFLATDAHLDKTIEYTIPESLRGPLDKMIRYQSNPSFWRQSGKSILKRQLTISRILEELEKTYPEDVAKVTRVEKETKKEIRGYEATDIRVDEICLDEIQLRRTDD